MHQYCDIRFGQKSPAVEAGPFESVLSLDVVERQYAAVFRELGAPDVAEALARRTSGRGNRRERAARIDLPRRRDRFDARRPAGVNAGVQVSARDRVSPDIHGPAMQAETSSERSRQAQAFPVLAVDELTEF